MDDTLRAESFDTYLARIHHLTQEQLRPGEAELGAAGIPERLLAALRDNGLWAMTIPRELGGLGWSMEEQARLTFEVTQASAVYRSRFSTTIGLCSQIILDHGTDEQRATYLPAMAGGACTGSFALTEPEAGSDVAALQTAARETRHGYVLDGEKRYITNAPDADVFTVVARTDPDPASGLAGLSIFLVPSDAPGLKVGPPLELMGQLGSRVADVRLDGCEVPHDALLGGREGDGFRFAARGLNHARLHVAATCVGQAIRLIEEATTYALGRRQFGQRIADFQAVENLLADSQAEMLAGRALVLDVARAFDAGARPVSEIAAAKYFCSEMVSRVADRAVQVLGGAGYLADQPVARLYRDTRLFRLFEGTSQIQQRQIARHLKRQHARMHREEEE